MNILSTILDRLNQRIEVGNIFDTIYGLCELVGEGNDKAWAHYIGNGQAIPVTNFDAKQGTLFWAKRGKITVNKNETLRLAGCRSIYETRFTLTAYAMVRKSHLPCDSADAQDWVASRVLRLISGTDPQFKTAIGAIAYEVVPTGYASEARYLPVNYEWAAVAIEVDVNVSTSSEDGCYDTCQTGDIPLPDFEPCEPCLTSVAVDGVTITGNGTPADPLVANIQGGGEDLQQTTDIGNSTTNDIDFIGTAGLTFDNGARFRKGTTDAGLGGAKGTAQICSISYELKWEAGRLYYMEQDGFTIRDVTHNFTFVPQPTDDSSKGFVVGSRWSLDDGTVYLCSDATIGAAVWAVVSSGAVTSVTATTPLASTGGTTPDISISQAGAASDGYLSSADWNTFDGKQDALTAGTGISITGTTIDNTAPDQVVSLTAGTGISVSGTYPSFTIDNTAPSSGGTVTSVAATVPNPTNPAFSVNVPNSTTTPSVNITANGLVSQYVRGDGSLDTFPSGLPPTGTAGGDLNGTYPNPEVHKIHGIDMQSGTPTANDVWVYGGSPAKWQHQALTQTQLPQLDATKIGSGNVSNAEFEHLDGTTSSIQTQLNAKEPTITAGTTSQYWRGDKSWQTLDKSAVGLGNVDNTSDANKPISNATQTALNGKFNTPSGTTSQYVRGDGSLATLPTIPTGTVTSVGLSMPAAFSVANSPVTGAGTLTVTGAGTTAQYIRGDGSLATFPSVLDTPYVESEIFADNNPLDVLVVPSLNRAYTANNGTGTVVIYDTTTNKRVASLSVAGACGVFYIASINQLWCTNTVNGNIARFNPTTGASSGADITGSGQRGQSYVEYSSTKVFIANILSNTITVVNPSTLTVTATIATGSTNPWALAYNNNPSSAQFDRIAFVHNAGSSIGLINPSTNAITIAATNPSSQLSSCTDIRYSSNLDRYIVSNIGSGNNNRLIYITPSTATSFAFDDFIPNFRPYELAIDNANNKLYSVNPTIASGISAFTTLSVINLSTKLVEKIITTNSIDGSSGGFAFLDIDLTNRYIYVVSYGGNVGIQRVSKIKI